jgi:hypothetical protein
LDQPAAAHVIDYLQEENRALREQLGPGRLRFTDERRRRLAAKAKTLGRRVLRRRTKSEVAAALVENRKTMPEIAFVINLGPDPHGRVRLLPLFVASRRTGPQVPAAERVSCW